MNRLRNIVGLVAVCATAAFFTGCGDDDNNDNNNQSNAPASLNGHTYNLTDAAGQSTIAFDPAANNYALTPSGGGAAETGTFTGAQSGETWNANLTTAAGDQTSTLAMTFTGAGTGTYTFTRPGQAPVSGNFTESNPNPTTTDPTTTDPTTTEPNPTTTDPGPGSVQAPANLSTITISPTSGIAQNTTFNVTLNGGQFTAVGTEGQDLGSGSYTYTPNGTTANLHLLYGGNNAGDFDDYNLVFTQQQGSGNANNFTGSQKVGASQPEAIAGTFKY